MRIRLTAIAIGLVGFAALAGAQERRESRERQQSQEPRRVWDPTLAQWRTESPSRVWEPNLAQYRHESRREVWDPYLAQYRPRDTQKDGAPPPRVLETRHWHPGRPEGCTERH